MNNANDHIVMDITPEEPTQPVRSRHRGVGWAVILLGLLLIGVAYTGYYFFDRQQHTLNALTAQWQVHQRQEQQDTNQQQVLQDQLQTQQQALADLQQSFTQQRAQFEQAQQQVQVRATALKQKLQQVQQLVAHSGTHWMVAEAEYLLRIAQHHLRLTRDVATVRQLLQQADQQLANTQNPDWHTVRRQIAQEIASLHSVKRPDHAGIQAQLQALSVQVEQLRLPHAKPTQPDEVAAPTAGASSSLLDDLWAGFQNMVRIRQHDQPIHALLPPAQQGYWYEQLRQYFQVAQLAVLRSDNALYQESLQRVMQQLSIQFDQTDQLTQTLLHSLQALSQINLRPHLPTIDQSLRQLRQQRELLDTMGATAAQ